jgi:hypothetical protein
MKNINEAVGTTEIVEVIVWLHVCFVLETHDSYVRA